MPDLQRQVLVYSGIDQTPVNDLTDATDWTRTELTNMASGGEAGAGTWVLRVPLGDIPDLRANVQNFLGPHNVIKVTVGSNTLFRGRLNSKDTEKGPTRGTRPQEKTVILSDYNDDLRGIVVHDWSRPLETDAARAQVLVARYLSGSPRPSTNLNGSNFVITGSNTSNRGFKTYTAITPMEILQELAETADKEMFVDVDGALHYHGHDYSGFDSFMRISDDPADLNSVTFMPIGPTSSEEGREQFTKLRSYWGGGDGEEHSTFVSENPIKSDYWEEIYFDDAADNSTEAATNARAILDAGRREQISYTMTVGLPGVLQTNGQPMTGDDIWKIKAGQRINVKARAARGGINGQGAYIGDTFQQMRIRSITWTFPGPDQYYARLELEQPKRLRGRRRAQPKATSPKPAPEFEPNPADTVVKFYNANDAGGDAENWTGNLPNQSGGANGTSWYNFKSNAPNWHQDTWAASAGAVYRIEGYINSSSSGRMTFDFTDLAPGSSGNFDSSSPHVLQTNLISPSQPNSGNTWTLFSAGPFTAPAGTTSACLGRTAAVSFDELSIYLVADPAENDEHAIDYGDCPHDSPHFLPSDYLECRLGEIDEQIAGLGSAPTNEGVVKNLTNKSGGSVDAGDLVIIDTTTDEAFTTTTTKDAEVSIGVAQETIANNDTGSVLLYGFATNVNVADVSQTRGGYAFHSSNAKIAHGSNTRAAGAMGQFFSSGTAPSLWLWGVGDQTATSSGGAGGGSGISTLAGCKVYNSTTQNITNTTDTKATFDSEEFDTDAFHDTSSNTSRITVPSGKAGYYSIGSMISWDTNGTGVRSIRLMKNGNTIRGTHTYLNAHGSGQKSETHTIVNLAVGDFIEINVFQNSGGTRTIGHATNSFEQCALWAYLVGT